MKSFNATWRASDWGEDEPDGVTVYRPGEESWDHLISHERQIEDDIPDAPEELKDQVQKEVMTHRKLEEDETRAAERPWNIGTMSVTEDGSLRIVWPTYEVRLTRECVATGNGHPERLAYLDKHGPELARAWFRANCPIDRFVTDEGRVLEFTMRDDGGADAKHGDGLVAAVNGLGDLSMIATKSCDEGVLQALYRFRDHERGKWRFDYAPKANHVGASIGGLWAGYWNANGWTPLNCYKSPTWVRQKAEALYREKNPEWRVEKKRDGEKVVFEGKVIESCCAKGESNAHIVTCEDVEISLSGNGFNAGWFFDVCKNNAAVRVTIEALEDG